MRFLRMLTNALAAGALGAAYLTILLLQLNPEVLLASRTTWQWYVTLALFYGVNLAFLFYALMLVRAFFSVTTFSPGWISVRLMAWLSSVAAAVASSLMWYNLRGFAASLTDEQARRFMVGAVATTGSAIVLLTIAVAHYSFGRRGSRVGAALLGLAVLASLALPLAARGPGSVAVIGARSLSLGAVPMERGGPNVTLLMIDGASLEYIWPRVAEGRLPNFGRVLDGGASMDLATIRPTQSDPVWAAVATGMYPAKTGVRSSAEYFAPGDDMPLDLLPDYCFSHLLVQLRGVREQAKTSAAWRARTLWAILGDYGITAGIVRWPLTYPVPPVRGFVVSDRYHQLLGSMFEFDGRSVYPPELAETARHAFDGWETAPAPLVATIPAGLAVPGDATSVRWDRYYSRALQDLSDARPVRFAALRYQGLDTVGHFFLRYAEPELFGSIPEDERLVFGAVLDRYYAYVDGEIGAAIDRLHPGDLLLVVSPFGMQPIGPFKHALAVALRQPDVSGTHDRAPDGFLLAYGTPVAAGRHQRGSIVDVTPTILYFLGVPVGRDMDGFARADLFSRTFTSDRPITFIPSHGR